MPDDGAIRRIGSLRALDFADLPPIGGRDYLVKGVVASDCIGVIYGQPGTGKTFAALDLALHVAAGSSWCGRKTHRRPVAYVGLEGQGGFCRRLAAWRERNHSDDLDFLPIVGSLDATQTGDISDAIDLINDFGGRCRQQVGLVVIDTLAQMMAGADENSPEGMGAAIRAAHRIRDETGATVLLIHHSGKDETRGARGHSSLKGAVDFELAVTRDAESSISTIKAVKQRDFDCDFKFSFGLEAVNLGTDADGDMITSCVIIESDPPDNAGIEQKASRKLSPVASRLLEILRSLVIKHGAPPPAAITDMFPPAKMVVPVKFWRQAAYDADPSETKLKAQNFRRGSEALEGHGLVAVRGDFVWLP